MSREKSSSVPLRPDLPVAVVGGGPVGSALSLFLAREGVPVVLLDAGASERKICGEGILPAGWQVLEDLGIDQDIVRRSPIEGLQYNLHAQESWKSMEAPLSGRAFGVQRPQLFQVFRGAVESSGVQLYQEARLRDFQFRGHHLRLEFQQGQGATRTLDCSHLLAADGLHSLVRRKAGLRSSRTPSYRRWGTRCYFRAAERRSRVEVTLGDGVESYLTPLGEDLYGLAFLWSPHLLQPALAKEGSLAERLMSYLPPGFRERLPAGRGELMDEGRAIGPLQQLVSSVLHPSGRIALVGDAGGYFDALTGEGLCLGLRQARSLSELLVRGRLNEYPERHRKIKARHLAVVGGLLWLIHRPALRERVFSSLWRCPKQFRAVIGFAVEEAAWWSLLTPQLPRFLLGLVQRQHR